MRLLFVITGLGTGGAERMLVKLLAARDRASGNHYEVVSLRDGGTQGATIHALGVPLHELHIHRLSGLLMAPLRLLAIAWRLRPTAIQGWMYHGNLAAVWVWLALVGRARLFWGIRQSFHGMRHERPLTRWVIRLNALCSRWPAAIIYNSRVSAAQHATCGFAARHAVVIPNGFDVRGFQPDARLRIQRRAEWGVVADDFVIGLVARYHPMKDHAGFLQAAALVVRTCPKVCFVLAGHGVDEENSELVACIKRLGLAAQVRLLGEVRAPEMLYPALDVLALSSAWGEAFPNVLGEAMACGVPCVATDVGDARWIVGDSGMIVSPRDAAALAKAMIELLQMPAEQRGALAERARARVQALFSIEAVAAEYDRHHTRELAGQAASRVAGD